MATHALARYSGVRINDYGRAPIVIGGGRSLSRRRHHGASASGGSHGILWKTAIAAAVLGYLDKNGTTFPTLPGVGRAGSLAIGCWLFRKKSPYAAAGVLAFGAIAVYEFITTGKISGVNGGYAGSM
jgi:hypothetical protein